MAFAFKESDFKKLSKVLGVPAKHKGNNIRYEVGNKGMGRKLAVEIYPDLPIGKRRGNLVSVYTPSAHLQLHFCSGFVVSEMLNEVTFIGEHQGNVDRQILSGDFTQLGPEIMLSGIALSLTESLLPEAKTGTRRKRP